MSTDDDEMDSLSLSDFKIKKAGRGAFDSAMVKADFHQNKAKAVISIYRQFEWVNCVKYGRLHEEHLRRDTGHLLRIELPFWEKRFQKNWRRKRLFRPVFYVAFVSPFT